MMVKSVNQSKVNVSGNFKSQMVLEDIDHDEENLIGRFKP